MLIMKICYLEKLGENQKGYADQNRAYFRNDRCVEGLSRVRWGGGKGGVGWKEEEGGRRTEFHG